MGQPAAPALSAFNAAVSASMGRGCTCRRSRCLQNYCVCFQSGARCGSWCRCAGCENNEGGGEGGAHQRAGDRATVATSAASSGAAARKDAVDTLTMLASVAAPNSSGAGRARSSSSANTISAFSPPVLQGEASQ